MLLDAYIRVSRVGGRRGESFISPDVQRSEIERWAAANGADLAWHEPELDVSGGTMDRPVFGEVMRRVRSGETQGVVVAKLDRFARSLVGALDTIRELDEHGAVLVCVRDNIDLSTPAGRAFTRILLVFAELERERIAEGFRDATSRAIARGVWIANSPPLGYSVDGSGRLVPDSAAGAVREVFRRRGAGEGPAALARLLDELAPLGGSRRWTPQRVWRLLSTRAYRGHVYYGELENRDAHPALVTDAEWDRAQAARAPSAPRTPSPGLLGGLVRCAACRYTMAPSISGSDRLYRCRRTHSTGVCPAPAQVRRDRLDEHVEALFLGGMRDRAVAVAERGLDVAGLSDEADRLEAELREFASDDTARSILGPERYHEAMRERAERVAGARAALGSALAAGEADAGVEGWDGLDTAAKRAVLAAAVDAVVVRRGKGSEPLGGRVRVLWAGEGPDDLPRRRRDNGPVRGFDWDERQAGMTVAEDSAQRPEGQVLRSPGHRVHR